MTDPLDDAVSAIAESDGAEPVGPSVVMDATDAKINNHEAGFTATKFVN